MAKQRKEDKPVKGSTGESSQMNLLLDHYNKGKQDVDIRRTRHNGWNQTIDVYMQRIPKNWPYTSRVTDPRLRQTIVEKTGRLVNSKLQGRLVPRRNATILGARLNNAILEQQWDDADFGGSMLEKIAFSDEVCRLYGSTFAEVFWDDKKNSNDIKILNPNDVFIDFAATHIRNAKWAIIREFTTVKKLKDMGINVTKDMLSQTPSDQRSNEYQDPVKLNKSLEDRVGQDLSNPTLLVAREITPTSEIMFLPKQAIILRERKNPSNHGKINIAQLRYYPLGDDVYGEAEAEVVLPLARAINSFLSAFVDEMNNSGRPPLKVRSNGVRMETLVYGPGAKWIMNDLASVEQLQMGDSAIKSFNNVYPALVAAFNTAMGNQSLGISNITGRGEDKTATEVRDLARQQFSGDQYNQQYLGEYLKDIMMMWLANNQQFLFDDPDQEEHILRIVGKDKIRDLQALKLDNQEVNQEAFDEVTETIKANPAGTDDESIREVMEGISEPTVPATDGSNEPKLKVAENGEEAELTITKSDVDGIFNYIPDIKSMARGAGEEQKEGRLRAFELLQNPIITQNLQAEGQRLNTKELIVTMLEDNGVNDAERLFEPIEQAQALGEPGIVDQAASGAAIPGGTPQEQGVPGVPAPLPVQPVPGGIPPA